MKEKIDSELFYKGGKSDITAIVLAFVLTVLIHIVWFKVVTHEFQIYKASKQIDELSIEIIPPSLDRRAPEFVEANPYGNQLEPDPDAPESFMTQRAAEEVPDPDSTSRRPSTEGDTPESRKIVQGTSSLEDNLSPVAPFEILERPLEQPAHPTERMGGEPAQAASATASPAHSQQYESAESAEFSEGVENAMQGKSESADDVKDEVFEEATQTESFSDSSAETSEIQGESKSEDLTGDAETSAASEEGEPSSVEDDDSFLRIEKRPKADSANRAAEKGEDSARRQSAPAQTAEAAKAQPQSTPTGGARQQSAAPQAARQSPEQLANDPSLPAPRSRPSLSMRIPAGPLAENRTRTSERGTVAVDSRFSEFGAYQQRMVEAISRQWNMLASKYDLGTAVGTQVIIEYTLNMEGDIVKLTILFSNSTNTGTGLCEQSILTTAPYGAWTQEMINSLGTQDQAVRITFYYR